MWAPNGNTYLLHYSGLPIPAHHIILGKKRATYSLSHSVSLFEEDVGNFYLILKGNDMCSYAFIIPFPE